MSTQAAKSPDEQLAFQVVQFRQDPMGYVMFAFPWTTEQSIQLCKLPEPWASRYDSEFGPDGWTCEMFEWLGEEIRKRNFNPERPVSVPPIQGAWSSGHGIGKGASVGMTCCFVQDTRPMSKGMVTANTGSQLRTKTFMEIAKWRELSITSHWWDISTAEMYVRHKFFPKWRLDGLTWRENESEASAGLHAADSTPYIIGDEASAIPESVLDSAIGGTTDGEAWFLLYGNPTRNKGYFYECFHKNKHRWHHVQVDSREVQITNKARIDQWVEDYGEDSDFVRVRVRGVFPRSGKNQLIGNDLVHQAMRITETPKVLRTDVVVMGVDVGGTGSKPNESVIQPRIGLDGRTFPARHYIGLDPTQLAGRVAEYFDEIEKTGHRPAMIFVDATGIGAGVFSHLNGLGYPACEVGFGHRADDPRHYLQKDAEMWVRTREWLKAGGALPDDSSLYDQLTHREYGHNPKGQLWIQRKVDMEIESESPDRADALALTFAFPVAKEATDNALKGARGGYNAAPDYNPLA